MSVNAGKTKRPIREETDCSNEEKLQRKQGTVKFDEARFGDVFTNSSDCIMVTGWFRMHYNYVKN